jgi:hypothetical protein
LEKEGLAWMRDRKCIACHHGPFLLWSHIEARRHGLSVDPKKVGDWTSQALALYLANHKNYEAKKNGCVEATNLLLGRAAGRPMDDKQARAFKTVADLLANGQKAEGFWTYEGQGLTWPAPEANEATSLQAVLALASADGPGDSLQRRQRALAWLKRQPRGEGAEVLALRLIVEARFGDPAGAKALAQELLARQNRDGGWSWARGRPSEAFATGQALYALARSGHRSDEPALGRARAFLLAGQRPDGSWHSPTRKPTRRDNPIADYWGTAWATIGLVQALPVRPE